MPTTVDQLPAEVAFAIDAAAVRVGVDPALARAVAWVESRGLQSARSPKGAVGVFQLMPSTADDLGVDAEDEVQNIEGGVRFLARMLEHWRGDEVRALASYVWGKSRVRRAVRDGLALPAPVRLYVARVLARREAERGGGGVARRPKAVTWPAVYSRPSRRSASSASRLRVVGVNDDR